METLNSKIIAISPGDDEYRLYALCQDGSVWALSKGKGGLQDRWRQLVDSGQKGSYGPGEVHIG